MKIAVVTPYHNEPLDIIRRAHQSVLAQKSQHQIAHILVADGSPKNAIDKWHVNHIKLPVGHDDYGDTPKWMGAIDAVSSGFDAVAFLDADDWLTEDHIQTAIDCCHATKADVCSMGRSLHRPDRSIIDIKEPPDDIQNHCVLLMARSVAVLSRVMFKPKSLCEIGDRIMWAMILQLRMSVVYSAKQTYCYSTLWETHYANETPPANAKKSCGEKFINWRKNSPQSEKDYWSLFLFGNKGAFDIDA